MSLLESPSSSTSTDTPIPASPASPSTPIPTELPGLPGPPGPPGPPEPASSLAASRVQSPPKPKNHLGDPLQSLLGTSQFNPPEPHEPHPIDLVHVHGGLVAPRLPPPALYQFKEMILGCRFVITDQWLTTRVDTTWTVSQVKLHMLTKLLGARRDQLKALSHPSEFHTETTSSSHPPSTHEDKTIATSNQSSIVFALHETSELDSLSHSPNPRYQPLPRPVERQTFDSADSDIFDTADSDIFDTAESDIPSLSSFTQSVPTIYQTRLVSQTDTAKGLVFNRHLPHGGFGAATAPPAMMDLNTNNVNKEDVLDELMDQLETDAKKRVLMVADKYCLMSFSCGNILDDRMTLTECRLRPFELLELQETARFLRIPRRVYLDTYWESPVEVRTRGGGELQGLEGIKKLATIEREEKVQQELQRDLVTEFVSNPADEAREEPRGAAASMILGWKNTPDARAKEHEEKRRKLLQKAEQEETKRQQREIKEAATEKWKERLAIVEGHQLNVWKNRDDDYPEQSWDLRRAVEVSVPKRWKQPEFPPGSVAAAYAALKNSNALNVIRVKEKQRYDMREEAKTKQPHYDLYIRFSIPLSSVNEALDPAGAAAKAAAKLKRDLKNMTKPPGLRSSASFSKLPFNSSDPFNQGVGFGTGTLEGAGSATLVLRLPDERSLENLSRIIHRSAGKYPLNQKRRRAGVLSEGGREQEVVHPDAMDATAMFTKQETKFHPYPEWRERILQKCVASGRHGFLTSPAWKARLNSDTGVYELPREPQNWQEDEEKDGKEEETMDEEENERESMESDAEWEGWRRDLELEGPTRPGSPSLNLAQQSSPWTSDSTGRSFITQSDGLLRGRRRMNSLISGRDKVLEGIVKRTTEHSVHPYSLLRGQPSETSTSTSVSPSTSLVEGMVISSGLGLDPAPPRSSTPPISVPISPRQSVSLPNRARSVTIATPNAAPKSSPHHTHDASHDLAIPLPNLPDALEDGRLPGLGNSFSSSHRTYHTTTTISALRNTDKEPPPKKGMASVWGNKGKRKEKTEDNPTGEEANVESPPLAADYPNNTWTHSYDEGLDRLRHMSSSRLRRYGSKGRLLKSFSLLDR